MSRTSLFYKPPLSPSQLKAIVGAKKITPPEEDEDRGKAALTKLFQEIENEDTQQVAVERVVDDIDSIVGVVRFPGWQQASAGEREVSKAHSDTELFEKAYDYIVGFRA